MGEKIQAAAYYGARTVGTCAVRPVVPGCAGCAADQLTLFQPGGTDYAHLITTGTPGFSDLPTALLLDNDVFKTVGNVNNK